MKQKAILIDFGLHYKQMWHASWLWSGYDLTAIVDSGKIEEMDGSPCSSVKVVGVRNFYFNALWYCLKNIFSFKKVIVLTGPEYGDGFSHKVFRILWLVFCFLFASKIDLYIKNTQFYEKHSLMRLTCYLVSKCYFESESQRSWFLSRIDIPKSKTAVLYVYYPGLPSGNKENCSLPTKKGRMTVGVIGQFDTSRRDYRPLLDLFDQNCLGAEFEFWQIGRFVHSTEANIIRRKYSGELNFIKDEFTTNELDSYISSCDILISMNIEGLGYGRGKGSAAFCEAACVKKPLVVPIFLMQETEFDYFCYCYSDCLSLYEALGKAAKHEVRDEDYEKYSIASIATNNQMVIGLVPPNIAQSTTRC